MAVEVATRAPSFPVKVANFYQEVVAEMRKVTWPTRDELVKATRMIVVLSVVLGLAVSVLPHHT